MLRIEDLSVSYGSVKALDRVNLEVSQRGVLHGVIVYEIAHIKKATALSVRELFPKTPFVHWCPEVQGL